MWLTKSSIGRKVIMAVTGAALVLFLTFHAAMNVVALISASGHRLLCGLHACRCFDADHLGCGWVSERQSGGIKHESLAGRTAVDAIAYDRVTQAKV